MNSSHNYLIEIRDILTSISRCLPERRTFIISEKVRQNDYAAAGKAYSENEQKLFDAINALTTKKLP